MGFFKNFFGRDHDDGVSTSEQAMDALAFGAMIGIAAAAEAEHEEEQARERLEELADEINAVQDETGISVEMQFDALSPDELRDQLDELRDKYEELQDEEPEDEFGEAHERWEELMGDLEQDIDDLEDQLDELGEV